MLKQFTTLYNKDQNNNVRYWYMEQDENKYRSRSGIVGRVNTSEVISDWTVVSEGTNIGKINERNPAQQTLFIINRMYTVRKEQGFAERIEDAGKKFFQPMLASKWDAVKSKITYPVYVQSKLDGIRLICDIDGMHSRHGKDVISAPHIRKALDRVFEENPELILDGELYCHDLNEDFNRIISLVRKSKPTPEDLAESERTIQYWVYDIPSVLGTNKERDQARKRFFEKYIYGTELEKYFVYVPSIVANSEEEVNILLELNLEQGFEGAIVRIPSGEYENKRSKNLLKYKKFLDEEFLIEDFEEGKGNLSGKVGRVVCRTKEGKRFSAGMKFSHDDARELWNRREDYIGKKYCTVKYFQLTPDGLPRFPKCIAIRDYE